MSALPHYVRRIHERIIVRGVRDYIVHHDFQLSPEERDTLAKMLDPWVGNVDIAEAVTELVGASPEWDDDDEQVGDGNDDLDATRETAVEAAQRLLSYLSDQHFLTAQEQVAHATSAHETIGPSDGPDVLPPESSPVVGTP
jgi:hypothetical protein